MNHDMEAKLKQRPLPQRSQEIKKAEALDPYNAIQADELSFKKGDVLNIRVTNADGWWMAELNGKVGLVPSNFLRFLEAGTRSLPELSSKDSIEPKKEKKEKKDKKEKKHKQREQGFQPQGSNQNKVNAFEAVKNENLVDLEMFVKVGGSLQEKDKEGRTLLLLAASLGLAEVIEWLLCKGSSLNERDAQGNTALILAAAAGKRQTIKFHLLNKASIEDKNNSGETVRDITLKLNQPDILNLFPQSASSTISPPLSSHSNETIFEAVKKGNLARIQFLYGNGANLLEKEDGNTLLIMAFQHHMKFDGVAECLIKQCPALLREKSTAHTPLTWAAAVNKVEALQWLVKKGVSLHEKNRGGGSAVILAVTSGSLQTIDWLKGQGVSLQEKHSEGTTLLMLALYNNKYDVAECLVKQCPVLLREESTGQYTPLTWAAAQNDIIAIKWLIKHDVFLSERGSVEEPTKVAGF